MTLLEKIARAGKAERLGATPTNRVRALRERAIGSRSFAEGTLQSAGKSANTPAKAEAAYKAYGDAKKVSDRHATKARRYEKKVDKSVAKKGKIGKAVLAGTAAAGLAASVRAGMKKEAKYKAIDNFDRSYKSSKVRGDALRANNDKMRDLGLSDTKAGKQARTADRRYSKKVSAATAKKVRIAKAGATIGLASYAVSKLRGNKK